MRVRAAFFLALLTLSDLAAAGEARRAYPIAGLAPDARPANAPRLTQATAVDRKAALFGISDPIPASLKFLEHQGGWFNPFLHPGMTGPYDLRGWHAAHAETKR